MFEPEPGPLTPRDPNDTPPYPAAPSFESIVADALADLPALDTRLAAAMLYVVDNPPDELDAVFNATVGAADDEIDNQAATFAGIGFADLVDNGNNEDSMRLSMLPFLPDSSATIDINFDTPDTVTE